MKYRLTKDDEAIFEVAKHNGSAFTAYYFDHVTSQKRDGEIVEGWQFIPWQLRVHHGVEAEQTLVGGFGSGKTGGIGMSGFGFCATVPQFRFLETAPVAWQSKLMYSYVVERLEGSKAMRFVSKMVTRPYPKITFYNGSSMEFMSADENAEKIKGWEGDWAVVDQAEDVDDLDTTVLNLGSRLRGRRPDGSERLGRLTILANAGDSPELWDRYDQVEAFPESYLSLTISYMDNPYLTDRDLENLRRRAGGTPALIQQWLEGKRPIGKGEHFPWSLLEPCVDPGLEAVMERAIKENRPGFVYQEAPKCGCVWWEMPHDPADEYIVIADPGQNDPPHRNAPVIMVWGIKDYPYRPAILRCFRWIFGGGSYQPFLMEYQRLVDQYHAQGQNAFDSTGTQKGFDELAFTVQHLLAEGMNMQGEKFLALNAAKVMLGKMYLRFPALRGLTHQLTHYRLPDTKIRQDITMTFAMSCNWLRRLLWGYSDETDEELAVSSDRAARSTDRAARTSRR
jgi:hypothetical protein